MAGNLYSSFHTCIACVTCPVDLVNCRKNIHFNHDFNIEIVPNVSVDQYVYITVVNLLSVQLWCILCMNV